MTSQLIPTFKILVLGESGAGKTSILRRFVYNRFSNNYLSTIGIDFLHKTIQINGKEINLILLDTSGQEKFQNIPSIYYKKVDGIFLVYDVSNKKSFSTIQIWNREINDNIIREEISLALIGNKIDILNRVVKKEEGQNMDNILKIEYYETSALKGIGINEAFEGLIKELMKKKQMIKNERNSISICLNNKLKREKKKCCH